MTNKFKKNKTQTPITKIYAKNTPANTPYTNMSRLAKRKTLAQTHQKELARKHFHNETNTRPYTYNCKRRAQTHI